MKNKPLLLLLLLSLAPALGNKSLKTRLSYVCITYCRLTANQLIVPVTLRNPVISHILYLSDQPILAIIEKKLIAIKLCANRITQAT